MKLYDVVRAHNNTGFIAKEVDEHTFVVLFQPGYETLAEDELELIHSHVQYSFKVGDKVRSLVDYGNNNTKDKSGVIVKISSMNSIEVKFKDTKYENWWVNGVLLVLASVEFLNK